MTLLMLVLGGMLLTLLLFAEAVRPLRSPMSLFELRRRQAVRDKKAMEALRREELLTQAGIVAGSLKGVLLIVLTMLAIYLFGWPWGITVALAIGVTYARIARWSIVSRIMNRIYRRYEPTLLELIQRHEGKVRILGGKARSEKRSFTIHSVDELRHVLEQSRAAFSDQDRQLIVKALSFKDLLVKDIMTKRNDIVAVKHDELLGPLVLDDLHRTGHGHFPVIRGDLDAVVGILSIRSFLALEAKKSRTAEKAMDAPVTHINEKQAVPEAMAAFLQNDTRLLVVLDEDGKTAGLLSLEDVTQALLGKDGFIAKDTTAYTRNRP